MSRRFGLALVAGLLFAGPPVLALSGTVVDERGKPIAGARVCQTIATVELDCVATAEDGTFSVRDMGRADLVVTAEGKLPGTAPGTGKDLLIELRPAPTLRVVLIDAATGRPIDDGEVFVVFSSAIRKGPFPVNRRGVRIKRLLEAGEIRVLGRSNGYVDAHAAVMLEPGKETSVTIELTPASDESSP